MKRVIGHFLFVCGLLLFTGGTAQAQQPAKPMHVLFVGNSLTYVNNLPALFAALANAQIDGTDYTMDLVAGPGGSIAERWQDGVAAREIAGGHWQVLVLQERGGTLACLGKPGQRDEPDCIQSANAHRQLSRLAKQQGMRVLVLGTWGPDAIWQGQLSRGLRKLANDIDAEAVDAGPPLRAFASAHTQAPIYLDQGLHPSIDASLLVSALLYRQIAGKSPVAKAFEMTAAMLPVRADIRPDRLLSQQEQIAGDGSRHVFTIDRLRPVIDRVSTP